MLMLMLSGSGLCLKQDNKPDSSQQKVVVQKAKVFAPLDIMK